MNKRFFKSLESILQEWGFSWEGLINNKRGEWWLISQIIIISAHCLPTYQQFYLAKINMPIITLGCSLFIIGIVISIRAFIDLGNNLSPLPDPKSGAKLVMNGVYRNCRHPLYQGILISSFGIFIYLDSLIHLFLFISLLLLLRGKALREEKKLKIIYSDYTRYTQKTIAILPLFPLLDW